LRHALLSVDESLMYPAWDTFVVIVKTDFIRVRVEPELKRQTEAVLGDLGMSVSDAVTVFCRQVVLQRALPFVVRIPNAKTQAALAENLSQAKSYDTVEEMFADILASDD